MYDQPHLGAIRPVVKQEAACTNLVSFLDPPLCDVTCRKFAGLDAFVLSAVLTAQECERLRTVSESMTYTFWNQSAPDKKDFRNADTVEVTDQGLADALWTRMARWCPETVTIDGDRERDMLGTWRVVGINPTLLFVRYGEGGHFSPHTDGYTILDFDHRSLYSVLVYLNTCAHGGATRLLRSVEQSPTTTMSDGTPQDCSAFVKDEGGRFRWRESQFIDQAPTLEGTALVFSQDLPHEGEPVGAGCQKYIIRTDVIYERVPIVLDSEADKQAYALYREAELLEADSPQQASELFRRAFRLSSKLATIYG